MKHRAVDPVYTVKTFPVHKDKVTILDYRVLLPHADEKYEKLLGYISGKNGVLYSMICYVLHAITTTLPT
jgi:hypothetical protein